MNLRKNNLILLTGLTLVAGLWLTKELNPPAEPLQFTHRHTPKADEPEEFYKLYNELRTRSNESAPRYRLGYQLAELSKARQQLAAVRTTAVYDFVERGPGNVPGRTRALVIDPDDPDHLTWYAGGVGGGIWKTTDGGATWTNKTPDLPNLAISWLVMAESNHDIMYAGTGEGWGASVGFIKGGGIFKTTDRGETWSVLPATANSSDFQMVNRLVVDPTNPDIVLAATNNDLLNTKAFASGIFKSTDGGVTWSKKFDGSNLVQQIVATPGNFNVLYATVYGDGVYKSTDAGETWAKSSNGLQANGRIEMTVSPVAPNRLFASVEGSLSGNGSDLFVSDDAGVSWNVLAEANNGTDVDFLGGQGWYDNTIAAHPFDKDVVYVGGVNLWKFVIQPGTVTQDNQFLGIEEQGSDAFMSLVNFGADYYGGRLDANTALSSPLVSVEIRFGPDGNGGYLKQMAHRFTVPDGMGSGVPAQDYTYQDYVEVPFQVWDVTNNRQLMVSFRDQQKDGVFNLLPLNADNADAANNSREYIYISNLDYNAAAPDTNIAQNGGQEYEYLYFFWPYLTNGATWDAANLPASKFIINFGTLQKRLRLTTSVADAYGDYGGPNGFSQTTGSTTQQGVHPDHHHIVPVVYSTTDSTFQLIVTNDGGLYKSDIGTNPGETNGSWTIAGIGYNTSQFYAVDKAPGENRYVGGMQDNGTWLTQPGDDASASAQYQRATSGDGFGCAWNYARPNEIITSVYNNYFFKTNDGGNSFGNATSGLGDTGGGSGPFVTELEYLQSDPDVLFTAGVSGVWRSTNFADNWELSEIPDKWSLRSTMKVRISKANSHIIWAGTAMEEGSSPVTLHVSTDEGVTFNPVNNYTAVTLGRISGLATHPLLDSTAFALFSFAEGPKILRTDDLGQSWYDISGFGTGSVSTNGFPDVAVYDLLVMPYDTAIIWAGTEIGIFESTDAGSTWHILNANMPAASVWELKIVDDQVVIATHGRGIWSVTINELPGQVYLPVITKSYPSLQGELLLDIDMKSAFDSTHLYLNGSLFAKLNQATQAGTLQLITNYTATKTGKAYVRSFYQGKPYVSHVFDFEIYDFDPVVDSYENDFSGTNSDFIGQDFRFSPSGKLTNRALHTTHNYSANSNYEFMLKKPIRVRASDALINFNEIVLVEPGNSGATPGSPEFKDYVVVQGSTDGITWVNLLDEYDASAYTVWQEAFASNTQPDPEMYRFRSINLLDKFQTGDIVLIRFKLVADGDVEGWGWVIDNLRIQTDNVITGIPNNLSETAMSLYPNPVTGSYVTLHNPGEKSGVLTLYNLSGQKIISQPVPAGRDVQVLLPGHIKDGLYQAIITQGQQRFGSKLIIKRN